MGFLRKLLWPLGVVYGAITGIRNFMYDRGILKSTKFDIPVIAVGNLSVGGTGKSPMIEYLIRLLSDRYNVATLSRGYKRKSKGFVLADESSDAEVLGDEPYQFHRKFPKVSVAVDANRCRGIQKLIDLKNPDVILLDDAFQHRKVKAGFYILLTSYDSLYADDLMLPAGNLRESASGAKRADVIIVTKCTDHSIEKQNEIRKKVNPKSHQSLFFSTIGYDDEIVGPGHAIPVSEIRTESKLLVAGIAKPKPFFDHLKSAGDDTMVFPDHHSFSDSDIEKIIRKATGRKIVTTEKDFVRLQNRNIGNLYYLPIATQFLTSSDEFDQKILQFVSN